MNKSEEEKYSPIIMWSLMVTFFMYQFVARSSFPAVLTEEYMKYFSLDAKGIGVLIGCYYIVYTFIQIPAGIVIDRICLRKIATTAIAICATGLLLFVSTTNPYIAGFGQMLIGLGSASSFLLVFKVIVNWFPAKKHPIMVALAISAGTLTCVICGPLVASIVKIFYWKDVMMAYAFIGYILSIIVWFTVSDKKSNDEEVEDAVPLFKSLKKIALSPQAWVLALIAMMQYTPLSALADLWGTSYIKKLYNADATISSFANNMIYLGFAVGGPIFSYLVNVFDSYKKTLLCSTTGAAIAFAFMLFSGEVSLNAMFGLFFAIGFFSSATLVFPLSSTLFPKTMSATVSAFINMGSMFSGIVVMPLVGARINESWDGMIENGLKVYSLIDYRFGFRAVLYSLIIAVVFVMLIRDRSPKASR